MSNTMSDNTVWDVIVVGQSRETMRWMRKHNIRFIPMFGRQSYKIDGMHHFYGGVNIEAVGCGWELCRVHGTAHNTGDGINAGLKIGARAHGGWSTCHAVQWDISAPPHGDRVVLDNFQKHSYPIGIVVNMNGERFIDGGAGYRNHTYAKYGKEVMKQPQRAAVQIFDAKTGELVGGIFCQNYPGRTGLLNGSVFGQLSGRNAGQLAVAA